MSKINKEMLYYLEFELYFTDMMYSLAKEKKALSPDVIYRKYINSHITLT